MPNHPEDEYDDDLRYEPPPRGRGSTHASRASGGRSGGGARGGSGNGPRGGSGGGSRSGGSGASGGSRSGGSGAGGGPRGPRPSPREPDNRDYNVYSSRPRGLFARLRGEDDTEFDDQLLKRPARPSSSRPGATRGTPAGGTGRDWSGYDRSGRGTASREPEDAAGGRRGRRRRRLLRPPTPGVPGGKLAFLAMPLVLPWLTPWRLIKTFILALVAWVVLSIVLFFVSASSHAGKLPAGAQAALTSSGPILTSANNILIVGLDNRPTTGYSSKEGGAQHSEATARTDTLMLWRVGGGVSRRLSIPRDTLVNLPGYGEQKINAAWPYGGPKLTIQTVEKLTGIKINHLIIVDLGNFPKFINDIGGVTVKTGRICSQISGGRKNGGYSLYLKPGWHHLNGVQAMTLARTRDNLCDPAYNDLNREAAQQVILNGIKSQLLTMHTFLHLPWASWDAPRVIQTDMGGLSLMELFAASQIGGSSPPRLLKETGSVVNGQDVLVPNAANVRSEVRRLMTGK